MKRNRGVVPFGLIMGMSILALVLVGCGGSGAAATPMPASPTDVPPLVATDPPAPTSTPVPPEATSAPVDVPSPTQAPSPTPETTLAPTTEPTPTAQPTAALTPVLPTTIDEFGFVWTLDQVANVTTAGWTRSEPDAHQGTLSFPLGEVITILIWSPQLERTALGFLADTYNILRGSQPDLTFATISDGDITVSGEAGAFGGFKTLNGDGATVGGGIIGTWICSGPGTGYRLTLTGADATVVQVRFDRLLSNFTCSS